MDHLKHIYRYTEDNFDYLGSKRRSSANLSSDSSEVDVLDFIGVKLGSHGWLLDVDQQDAENAECIRYLNQPKVRNINT